MAKRSEWTTEQIPSLIGKRVVITGTGGLGYETALVLAAKGAEVILAGRNAKKGADSVQKIHQTLPQSQIEFAELDLASLDSVKSFSRRLLKEGRPLDILINNAGVMALPQRQTTKDGFEMQFGTNYLGHFALTAHLLPLLKKAKAPRVVSLSSTAHLNGKIHFDDLQFSKSYSPWAVYSQSKLAMLMFALELQRKSDAGGWGILSLAAHPGYALTDLMANGPGEDSLLVKLGRLLAPFVSQSAADGAWPTLLAATSPDVTKGGYYGPKKLFELKGPPGVARISKRGQDAAAAARLWSVSEQLTGVRWSTREAEATL